jgi:hypothetical protein
MSAMKLVIMGLCLCATAAATVAKPQSLKNCSEAFVATCLGTATPDACDACIVATPAGVCDRKDKLEFYGLCSEAPFNTASENCLKAFVTDCSAKLSSDTECEACLLAHHAQLEASNCTKNNFAELLGLCTRATSRKIPTPVAKPQSLKNCSEAFVATCLGTATPDACDACIVATPAGVCDRKDKLEFYGLCSEAPFNTASENCLKNFVSDCSAKLASDTECEACLLAHHAHLEASNCTKNNFAELLGLCTRA